MPESILTVLKLLLLALLYLFFLRVLRAVWAETASADDSTLTAVPAAQRAPRAARPAAAIAAGRLKVVAPPTDRGKVYELGDEVTVGRAPGCQVSLAGDSTVSQLHARIWRTPEGRLMVEDLGSTNGTFLNRKKLTGAQPLRQGDRLQVGQTVLEVAQ